MKSKHPISRLALLIIVSAVLGLTASAQDTITIKTRQFDSMVQDIEINSKQNQAFRTGFDSLRLWYNELAVKYEQSQRNLASCLAERDLAHRYIDTLRTNLSKAWTAKDVAEAKVVSERNRKVKPFGIGLSAGYNVFTRLPYAGVGLSWNFIRFGIHSTGNSTAAPSETEQVKHQLFNR